MLADKDIAGVIAIIKKQIDVWVVAGVDGPRALAPHLLAELLQQAGAKVEHVAGTVAAACQLVRVMASEGDRIVVFGSFHAVGPALAWLQVTA
jgi:dihydrofolate synthase/folylpolyglutamate synthase